MFSIVMVASSTRIPIANARPPSVMTLSVCPIALSKLSEASTLSGIEMGLRLAGVPHRAGGVMAALDSLAPAIYEAAHSATA